MFTINIYIKFAIIGLCIFGGIALAIVYGFWYAFPFFLIGLIFLASYIFLGTVQSAAQIMELQDFDAAEQRLNLTAIPSWLYSTNRAYYFIIQGSIQMGRNETEKAKEFFKKAKELSLPSDDERAIINMQLAGIYAKHGNWNAVKTYVKELKTLNITQPQIKDQLAQFEQALSQRGRNPQMMRQAKNFRPGGKRRRPKMR